MLFLYISLSFKNIYALKIASGNYKKVSDIQKLAASVAAQDNLIPEGHNVLIFSETRIMLDLIQSPQFALLQDHSSASCARLSTEKVPSCAKSKPQRNGCKVIGQVGEDRETD
ncbi:hypothetical protein L1887_32813 [Cichorium endivia]|nr:hypothetical protein L1887_32813 [Cichorium endivia]